MARIIRGLVVSDKASKTIIVSQTVRKTHPLYQKQYTRSRKFMAHDENEEARVGDTVSIIETRPLSARKRFTLRKVIERAAITESDRVENVVTEPEVIETKKTEATAKPEKKAKKQESEK